MIRYDLWITLGKVHEVAFNCRLVWLGPGFETREGANDVVAMVADLASAHIASSFPWSRCWTCRCSPASYLEHREAGTASAVRRCKLCDAHS